MPTSEWKAATSSGIAVMGTRRAITAPAPPPMPRPRITSTQEKKLAGGCSASVVATAIAMPIMPNRLPCRLVAGLERPRSERMKRTPATRYRNPARFGLMWSSPLLLVHRQHALGDKEAAEDILRGQDQREETEQPRPNRAAVDLT